MTTAVWRFMVRSYLATSGVLFSIDTESGFDQVVFITAAYGLGKTVVQDAVNPDEFYVHKPGLAVGRPAIVRCTPRSKKIRMVYAPTQEHGKQVGIEDVPQPDRDRFCVTSEEVHELAKQAVIIEQHYGRPMDIEWAKDGRTSKLYIVQARPETSDHEDFAAWLMAEGIDSLLLNPDTVVQTWLSLAQMQS